MQQVFFFQGSSSSSWKDAVIERVQKFLGMNGKVLSVNFSHTNGDCVIIAENSHPETKPAVEGDKLSL